MTTNLEQCLGGAEMGVDWINRLILHENDRDWHPDPAQFEELESARIGCREGVVMLDLTPIKERWEHAARSGHPFIRDSWLDVEALIEEVERLRSDADNA